MVMVKCDCGYFDDSFRYGVNMSYSRVKEHQTSLVRSGRYGRAWRELLASDAELNVDAELNLYQCPYCHTLKSDYCLDLYKSKKDDQCYYIPTDEEVLHHYKHLCPHCQKRMKKVPLCNGRYYDENPEELVVCPKCGDIAIASFCGFTD